MNWRNIKSVQLINRLITKLNYKIIAVSNSVKEILVEEGIKKDRIDTIYNEQRNELQKFGNYHQSLRTAIQSSLAKKNLVRKKK